MNTGDLQRLKDDCTILQHPPVHELHSIEK
jgi:hypothetical protein